MNYHNITYPDQNNGDGLRVVLWLSGCSHRCNGCQNPQTWDANSGLVFGEKEAEEIFRELSKDYISGITLSGGDPLCEENLSEVLNLVNKINILFPNKTIWLYTGFTWKQCMDNPTRKEIVSKCNVVVDGKYIDELKDITLKWRGSTNQRVIDVKQSISKNKIILYCD